VKARHTCRGFKNDPVPEGAIEKILEAARWAMSGASTPGRHQTHLTDGLSNASMILHLAAAALGLASQWVSIHVQEPFKQILDVPPLLTLHTIIPVGYPKQPLTGSYRRKLHEIVHACGTTTFAPTTGRSSVPTSASSRVVRSRRRAGRVPGSSARTTGGRRRARRPGHRSGMREHHAAVSGGSAPRR
jgi:hypothetical protein